MNRTFLNYAGQPITFVSVQTPVGDEVITRNGIWGNKGRQKTLSFSSHSEAVDEHTVFIGNLLGEGFTELPPFVEYRKGNELLRVRPPITPTFTHRKLQGPVKTERTAHFETTIGAIKAYNRMVTKYTAAGFTFTAPPCHDDDNIPIQNFSAHSDAHRPERNHGKTDAPEHTWRAHCGQDRDFRFMVRTPVFGTLLILKCGALYEMSSLQLTAKRGPVFLFGENGSIRNATFPTSPSQWAFVILDGTKVVQVSHGAKNQDYENIGLWKSQGDDCQIVETYAVPGQLSDVRHFRLDGTLSQHQQLDEAGLLSTISYDAHQIPVQRRAQQADGGWKVEFFAQDGETVNGGGMWNADEQEIGTWVRWNDGVRVIKVYSTPGVASELTFMRQDGTIAENQRLNKASQIAILNIHDEAGVLIERRTLQGRGGWKIELMTADGKGVHGGGMWNADQQRVGVWEHRTAYNQIFTRYDDVGALKTVTFKRADGTIEEEQHRDTLGITLITLYNTAGIRTERRTLQAQNRWQVDHFGADGAAVKGGGMWNARKQRIGIWVEFSDQYRISSTYGAEGKSVQDVYFRTDGSKKEVQQFTEDGEQMLIEHYCRTGSLTERSTRLDDKTWTVEFFDTDGATVRGGGTMNAQKQRVGKWTHFDDHKRYTKTFRVPDQCDGAIFCHRDESAPQHKAIFEKPAPHTRNNAHSWE